MERTPEGDCSPWISNVVSFTTHQHLDHLPFILFGAAFSVRSQRACIKPLLAAWNAFSMYLRVIHSSRSAGDDE